MERIILLLMIVFAFGTAAKSQTQSDTSDAVFSIVEPLALTQEIDMGKVLISTTKDSLVADFISNTGSWKFRVDSIYFRGSDAPAFSLVSGFPQYIIDPTSGHFGEFRFNPTQTRIYQAEIVIFTQSDTLYQTIRGEGIEPKLAVLSEIIDFGKVFVGRTKDSLRAVTIKNTGKLVLSIIETKHAYPNAVDFTTVAGGEAFSLDPGDTCLMDLRFAPSQSGRTSGTLEFHYNGVGSPAIVQLFGEGIKPKPDISSSGNTTECESDSVVLTAGAGYLQYKWSTGETSQSIVVRESGSFRVSVEYESGSWAESDEITVSIVKNYFEIESLPSDRKLDFGTLYSGDLICKRLRIKNRSNKDAIINNIKLSRNVNYSIPQSQIPANIKAGESIELYVCFTGRGEGSRSDTLWIADTCDTHWLELAGAVIKLSLESETRCGEPIILNPDIEGEQSYVEIYPNPASEAIELHLKNAKSKQLLLSFIDSRGIEQKTILLRTVAGKAEEIWTIPTDDLDNGLYNLLLSNGLSAATSKLLILK